MSLNHSNVTLTDYEQLGFFTEANLADGHAYHELSSTQLKIIERLEEIWHRADSQSIPASERSFLEAFSSLISSDGLRKVSNYMVLPTASNSIDLIGAYLHAKKLRVMLTHPTFDNLALLLRRRGVPITPISDDDIIDVRQLNSKLGDVDVLFLVNPNNPTGTNLSKEQFISVVDACNRAKVSIIFDASFRLYYPQLWDSYEILNNLGASYIVFEDTGKVFPTQDMKASLLCCSSEHATALQILYNEVYLCVSKFTLGVLSEFILDAGSEANATFHYEVQERRKLLRSKIDPTFIDPRSTSSRIGVEWMRIPDSARSDIEFVETMRSLGLTVLPGRNFFWERSGSSDTVRNFRVSLMKPLREFELGIDILSSYLSRKEI